MAASRSAQVYADFLLTHLTTEMHLIDVGCGSGELSLDLAKEVGHVTGIDDDPAEIELARTAAEASSTSNADFTVGDGTRCRYQITQPTPSSAIPSWRLSKDRRRP